MTTPTAKLSFWEKSGYGLGDAASNFFFQVSIYFIAFFYTDVFGISPAALGTMFLVVRIWDTVNDPIMGVIADRTNTRWGKFRPWMLWGAIPFGLIFAATFTTPELGTVGRLVYAYVTYTAMLMAYTVSNVPYSALMGVMTPDPVERTQISTFRFVGAFCAGFVVQYATLHLVTLFSGGSPAYFEAAKDYEPTAMAIVALADPDGEDTGADSAVIDTHRAWLQQLEKGPEGEDVIRELFALSTAVQSALSNIPEDELTHGLSAAREAAAVLLEELRVNRRTGYQWTMSLFGGIATVFWILSFLATRERVSPPAGQSSSLRADLGTLRQNGPWIVISLVNLFMLIFVVIRGGSLIYFFKYCLQAESVVPNFLLAIGICSILGAMAAPVVVRLMGKKLCMILCMGVEALCFVLTYWVYSGDWALLWGITIVAGFLNGVHAVIMWAILADSADYGEWKTGRRNTGLIFSSGLFALKSGVALGGACLGWYLSYVGFVADAHQTAEAAHGLRLLHSVFPGVLAGICLLIMLFYPLAEGQIGVIAGELEARRNLTHDQDL